MCSPRIKLASPRVLNAYSPLVKNVSYSPNPTSITASFTQKVQKGSLTPEYTSKDIEQSLVTLDIKRFSASCHARHVTLSKPAQSSGDLTPAISNAYSELGKSIFICLCGKIMVDTGNNICDDCYKKSITYKMSGHLYAFSEEKCEIVEYWGMLNDKELYLYESESKQNEKPLSIVTLVDNYISSGGYHSINYKDSIYVGFSLGTGLHSLVYYVPTDKEKLLWVNAINSVAQFSSISDFYDIIHSKILGKGKFSVVKEAIHKQTGIHVAVKILSKMLMTTEDIENIRREVDILKLCNHPNIIKLYDFFENENYSFIVVELIKGCDLVKYTSTNEQIINEGICAKIIMQLY
jgi:Protein kinase domain